MIPQLEEIGYVIDIESTCWDTKEEQGSKPNEVIEIGVAVLEYATGKVIDRASLVVKPRFTKVSPFCTQLTGWTQEQIDENGKDIARTLREFKDRFKPTPRHVWYSCGQYDKNMLSSNTQKGLGALYGIKADVNPFDIMQHVNIKAKFAEKLGLKKEKGMDKMLEHIGEKLEGRHHNGSDDAFNIAKIVMHVLGPMNSLQRIQADYRKQYERGEITLEACEEACEAACIDFNND